MPVYEYACTECGLHFERHQSFTDDPIQICPECDGQVRRIIHPARVIFKGSGFYETDYRSDSYKKAAKADSESKDAKSGGADKSETPGKSGDAKKPAAKKKDVSKKK